LRTCPIGLDSGTLLYDVFSSLIVLMSYNLVFYRRKMVQRLGEVH